MRIALYRTYFGMEFYTLKTVVTDPIDAIFA